MASQKENGPLFEDFYNDSLGKVSFGAVIDEVLAYVAKDTSAEYRIFIGSDSLSHDTRASIVSTIVAYKIGNGGRYFWHRFQREDIYNLRDKIHAEVQCSIELAQKVLLALSDKIADLPSKLEVHLDVGQNGNTRDLITEVVGWVRAYGLNVKTKPDSVAATSVADRRTILPTRSIGMTT